MYSEQQAQNCCIVAYINGAGECYHIMSDMISLMPGLLTMCSLSGQTQHFRNVAAEEKTSDGQLAAVQKVQDSCSIIAAISKPACS